MPFPVDLAGDGIYNKTREIGGWLPMKGKLQLIVIFLVMMAGGICIFVYSCGISFRQVSAAPSLQILFFDDQPTIEIGDVSTALCAPLPDVLGAAQLEQIDGSVKITYGDIIVLYVPEGKRIPAVPATVLACYGDGFSEELLEAVKPDYTILLSRAAPEEHTLHLLDACCKGVFRRDLQGKITLDSNGKHVHLTAEKAASSQEIFPYREKLKLEAKETVDSYVINRNSKVFHLPSCPSVEQMKVENRLYSSDARDALIEKGYRPCGSCQP